MNFLDWMSMNMIIDIACIVFGIAFVWKMKNIKKEISLLRGDLDLAIKNPQAAKRKQNK